MIHLSNITLSNINIHTKLSDTDQINSYVEAVSSGFFTSLSSYLSKSEGGEISANLSVTSSLFVANNMNVGIGNDVVGNNSCAIGHECIVKGNGAVAEGLENYAFADGGHSAGDGYCCAGTRAFTIITADSNLSTLTLDSLSCEYGHISSIINSKSDPQPWIMLFQRSGTDGNVSATFKTKLLGINNETNTISVNYIPNFKETSGKYSPSPYVISPKNPKLGTTSVGSGAYAHGYQCIAMEDSTAFGVANQALGRYSFAIGNANRADYMGVAIGSSNAAYGQHSIAMGGCGSANSNYENTTVVYSKCAFGWSGNGSDSTDQKYIISGDNRIGTFNVNPQNGLSGFYIGNDNFVQCVLNSIKSMSDDQKLALKNALSI